jgi:hypothetical protein
MIYLLSLFLIALMAGPTGAQSSGSPSYVVGDEWTLSTGLVRKVVKVEGDTTVISGSGNCRTCLLHFDKNLVLLKIENADGSPVDSVAVGFVPLGTEWRMFEFPMDVGKSWKVGAKGLVRNQLNQYDVMNTVQAYEDVTTKAGSFKAFKIVREWQVSPPDSRGRGLRWTTTEWFAPAAKGIVKWTSTSPNARDWELASYAVK